MPDQSILPVGWEVCSVADLVDPLRPITYGIVQPGPRFDPGDGVPMIRGQDYSDGVVSEGDLYHVSPRLAATFDRASVRAGDILMSIVGYVGTVAEVPTALSGANLTQTTARISLRPGFRGRYFLHFMRSEQFREEVKKYTKGSAQPGLNLADVEKMQVCFPRPELERKPDMPEFSILHSMAQVRPNLSAMTSEFMLWAMRAESTKSQMGLGTQSIGVPDLGLDKISNFIVVKPPLQEQKLVASRLDALQERIDLDTRDLGKMTTLKSGLMDDLLTGRVRVTPLLEQAEP